MYGLVNKAIEEMVCSRFGEETWETIKEKADVDIDFFMTMEAYPDDLTHRLVHSASEVLGISADDILQAFGEYWVIYTASEGYAQILDLAGDNLREFLGNLDNLHARVGLNFPQLQPPSFRCTDNSENSMELHYYSHRQGLAPMVKGLLKGLACRFHTEVEIEQTSDRTQGADRDVFSIHCKSS
ncbi:MAG: heme NO-binding domain-containing protein [Microcoleus sp. CAN_BIN18]|nr:heme NO-binding domain-containing protein [Microcoleus sp. CAN_BIN18]